MSKSIEKLKAIQLRKNGWSIKNIAKELSVSRSSASVWCSDVVLTAKQFDNLKAKQIKAGLVGRLKGAEVNRTKKLTSIQEANNFAELNIKSISKQELFYLGLGIYWGEGVKSKSGQTSVINSDPRILKIMVRWFEDCFGVQKSNFRPYVYINSSHKKREKVIMTYWYKVLGIPASQFKSPIYLNQAQKKEYFNHEEYFGVVALRIMRSTNLKYQILAFLKTTTNRLD